MSDRRLPNTDNARIVALRSAVEKAVDTDYQELSLSIAVLEEAKSILSHFERLSARYQQLCDIEEKVGRSFSRTTDKACMYVSHFIQVLCLCVVRAEIREEQLDFYGLGECNMAVPDLSSCELLLEWGEKIISGEYERIAHNGVPIYNPSIARVNVLFELFKEGYQTQKLHHKATDNVLQEMVAMRKKVDEIILEIWEEVEMHNIDLPPDKQLARNREYGIVYY